MALERICRLLTGMAIVPVCRRRTRLRRSPPGEEVLGKAERLPAGDLAWGQVCPA